MENTVAHNTRLRADLPQEASNQLTVDGYLWADNASAISDTAVVNVSQPQMLEYVPGSTKWFPDQSQTGQTVADGITSANGLNIGDIQGCWPYAGFVTFRAKLVTPPAPDLVKSKSAYNVTQSANAESVVARPNDLIRYSLTVTNNGSANGNIVIEDDIASVLRYAQLVDNGGGTLNGSTISWPESTVQDGQSVTKTFKVRVKENIPANQTVHLINTYGNRVNVPARRDVSINPGMNVIKKVRNVTQGETNYVNRNSANPGDILEYEIRISNQGDINLEDLVVEDALPAKLNYSEGSARIGYGSDSNTPISDSIVGNGVNLGQLTSSGDHQSIRIEIRGTVKSNLTEGEYTLVNRVEGQTDYTSEVGNGTLSGNAQAVTDVEVAAIPCFEIDKRVKNITRPSGLVKEVTAFAGDHVLYQTVIKNTSQTTITDLRAVDMLPANTSLIEGSVRLKHEGKTSRLSDSFASNYLALPNLSPGESITITLKAQTDKQLAKGVELVNTAQAEAAGKTKNSNAKIVIKEPQVKATEIKGPLPKTGTALYLLTGLVSIITGYGLIRFKLI
jgi:uncharacterized repeat protein (TIGR01451 family)